MSTADANNVSGAQTESHARRSASSAGSPARWLVVRIEDEPVRVVEVRDVMECIHGPGDYGWVTPVDDAVRFPPGGVIANFEQLHDTEAAAVGARVAELRDGIAKRLAELERWGVQENDVSTTPKP